MNLGPFRHQIHAHKIGVLNQYNCVFYELRFDDEGIYDFSVLYLDLENGEIFIDPEEKILMRAKYDEKILKNRYDKFGSLISLSYLINEYEGDSPSYLSIIKASEVLQEIFEEVWYLDKNERKDQVKKILFCQEWALQPNVIKGDKNAFKKG